MRVTATIFPMLPGYRVAIYALAQHPEIWCGAFPHLAPMVAALHEIGIINDQERAELPHHDFSRNFVTAPAEIDLVDALTAGFLPYVKNPIQ